LGVSAQGEAITNVHDSKEGYNMRPGARLPGKVAIISGEASGIGAETARVFAIHGATIVLCDVQEDLGRAVAKEITDAGGPAEFHTFDVCNEQQWSALVAGTEQRYGAINVLCNIAGISGRPSGTTVQTGSIAGTALVEQTLEGWNRIMEVNATGVFLGTTSVIPAMQRAGGGSIVNISSICGIVGSFANAAYHASKGAVRIFSKSAAMQYAKDQIRVNSVHPGFVDTPMARPGLLGNESGKARMDATPLGRFGKPLDIAMGCLYLASDESAWMTGSELVIDGGTTAN
jgi:NAD(P)-dependent dehydrogenase (short-subunit alcohol dehydrogenase family)